LALRVIGTIFIALLFVWALRPHPRRWMRGQLITAFVFFTTIVLYRTRPDSWAQPDLSTPIPISSFHASCSRGC
jgi:hypothetical protein